MNKGMGLVWSASCVNELPFAVCNESVKSSAASFFP
jgi:hypothetical protein